MYFSWLGTYIVDGFGFLEFTFAEVYTFKAWNPSFWNSMTLTRNLEACPPQLPNNSQLPAPQQLPPTTSSQPLPTRRPQLPISQLPNSSLSSPTPHSAPQLNSPAPPSRLLVFHPLPTRSPSSPAPSARSPAPQPLMLLIITLKFWNSMTLTRNLEA